MSEYIEIELILNNLDLSSDFVVDNLNCTLCTHYLNTFSCLNERYFDLVWMNAMNWNGD